MASGWTPFSINLFKGKTKLEKSLREDFNASCFDDGLFFVTEDVAEALCKVTDFFEQLQVITDDGRCFYYMNLTRKIRSLFLNDRSELKICIVVGFINSMKVSLPMKLFLEMIFCLRITLLRKSF